MDGSKRSDECPVFCNAARCFSTYANTNRYTVMEILSSAGKRAVTQQRVYHRIRCSSPPPVWHGVDQRSSGEGQCTLVEYDTVYTFEA